MKKRNASVALLTLFITACGGSDDSAPPTHPIVNLSTIRSAIPGEQLDLGSEEIRTEIARRTKNADSLVSTDIIDGSGNYLAAIDCTGTSCEVFGRDLKIAGVVLPDTNFVPVATRDGVFNISEIKFSNTNFVPVMKRNGVAIAQGTELNRVGNSDSPTEQQSITSSGWTEHSIFYVDGSAFEFYDGQEISGRQTFAAGVSIGDTTGGVPVSGTAKWKGVVVAGDHILRELHQGDAVLTVNFSNSSVDAHFTDFYDVATGTARDDITFNQVPLTSDGFERSLRGHKLVGKFYGPNHAEVGGIFERENRFGAFGAIRQ